MSAPAQDPLALDLGATGVPAHTEGAGSHRLTVIAYGLPAGQGNLVRNAAGALYGSNAKMLKPWRDSVVAAAQTAMAEIAPDTVLPMFSRDVPVEVVSIVWTFARPAYHFGSGRNAGVLKASAPAHHVGTPDIDKLLRAALDALTAAGCWHDDRQVCATRGLARVYPGGHPDSLHIPGAVIRIRAVPR